MQRGDIVFFKTATNSTSFKAEKALFRGHGFGLLLGQVPRGAPDVPMIFVFRELGKCGFISFDDVIEFVGEEVGNRVVKKFEEKYYPRAVGPNDPLQHELPLGPVMPAPRIVGLDGVALEVKPEASAVAEEVTP